MSNRCEDYPCCGHTDDDPCGVQYYDLPAFREQMRLHVMCDHIHGYCDLEDDEECDPRNGVCAYDDDECETCTGYWLEFHAEGIEDQRLTDFYKD